MGSRAFETAACGFISGKQRTQSDCFDYRRKRRELDFLRKVGDWETFLFRNIVNDVSRSFERITLKILR